MSVNPLDFSPSARPQLQRSACRDLIVSLVGAAAAHPFNVLKSLFQSPGVALSTIRAQHLLSGIGVRLWTTPIYMLLSSSNYAFKARIVGTEERTLRVWELVAAAAASSLFCVPLYQTTDVLVYHMNLSRLQGQAPRVKDVARGLFQQHGLLGWARTLPITTFLATAGGVHMFATAPLTFWTMREKGASTPASLATVAGVTALYSVSTQPLDTLRTRALQALDRGLIPLAKELYKEPTRNLWRGAVVRLPSQVGFSVTYCLMHCAISRSAASAK